MLWRILETRGNIFKIATEKNLEGGKRLKEVFEKNKERLESGPFPLGQLRTAGFIKESQPPLLAVDVCSRVATKKARRNRASRKEEKKFGPAIVPVLKCPYALLCMNMTMMIPAAWVALFLLVALSYPAMA